MASTPFDKSSKNCFVEMDSVILKSKPCKLVLPMNGFLKVSFMGKALE